MKNKKTSFLLVFSMFFMMASMLFIPKSYAADMTGYPAGCVSSSGYSSTTGTPCNNTSTVSSSSITGCANSLGYSSSTNQPCSGTTTAFYLAGCASSTLGYSSSTGSPCNGTSTATGFAQGCQSIFGYNSVDGKPCNGTSTVQPFITGCGQSTFGYSSVSGMPCNGTATAVPFPSSGVIVQPSVPAYTGWQSMAGCMSPLGYSSTGIPCNGSTNNAFVLRVI